jgi:hypothetical protein
MAINSRRQIHAGHRERTGQMKNAYVTIVKTVKERRSLKTNSADERNTLERLVKARVCLCTLVH